MRFRLAVSLVALLTLAVATTASAQPAGAPAPAAALEPPAPAPAPDPEREDRAGLNWAGFGIRFGVFNLDVAAENVPFFDSKVQEALDAYNRLNPGNQVTENAMDLEASLVQVVPTLHLGGDGFFFRLDLPIGFGDDITTLGLGLYPLAYGHFIESLGLFPYAVLGGAAHYATSGRVTSHGAKFDVSQSGAVLQGRLAVGAKLRIFEKLNGVGELGFSPWTVAGLVDTDKLDAIKNADTSSSIQDPASAVRAGAGSSFDFSVGIEWL